MHEGDESGARQKDTVNGVSLVLRRQGEDVEGLLGEEMIGGILELDVP